MSLKHRLVFTQVHGDLGTDFAVGVREAPRKRLIKGCLTSFQVHVYSVSNTIPHTGYIAKEGDFLGLKFWMLWRASHEDIC